MDMINIVDYYLNSIPNKDFVSYIYIYKINVYLYVLNAFLYRTEPILMKFFVCLIDSLGNLHSRLDLVGSTWGGAQMGH